MITETESGLTAGQYTEIQVETEQMRYSVEAQRYAPSFSSHDSDSSMTGSCFDACIAGDWLVRAFAGEMSDLTVERLARENEGDETWEDVTVAATDINPDIDLSVVASGNAVRVFFVSEDDKVQYVECADISVGSPEFGVPVDVERVEDIIALAATGTTKLYYAVLTEDDNRHLYFTEYTSGAWSEYDSDIYYPFGIYGMDAVDIGDEDVVVMGAELPPIVGSRAVGTEVTTDVQRVQGIIVWRVASNRWSEHIAFDSDDLLERFPSRLHVRASYINSQIFMSYKRLGGFGDHTFNRLAVSRSVDGNDWEFPHLFNQSGPAVVLPTSDYLYMVGIDETTRSECCVWAGQTPASLDITDYVSSISSQAADIRATEVTLEDVGGALDDTLAKSEDWVQLVFGLGYYLPTDVSAQTMQVSIEDVVVTKDGRTLPIRTIGMSCQDRLGRVNRVNSDVTMELIPHQAGRDALDDPTDTGYGGLRHLAPYEGSWAADNGVLDLKSNKNQGIVVSTFVADALCGSAQNGFLLAYTDKGEYGGLAFRVYDKDNLYYVAYFADDDVIKLIKRVGGSETTLSESAAMSWTIDGDNWYYLRIRVHYNHLYVYTSTDGVTWTALSWDSGDGELPGYSASSSGDDLEVWAGRFGIVGYGYSDDDSWDDWTPTPWPGPVTEPSNWGVIVTCKEYVGRSFNFFETEQDVIWQDITGAMAGHQIIRLEVGKQGQAYCTTDYGIFYTSSITARTVKWNCIQTLAAMRSETGFANAMFQAVDISDGGTAYFPVHEWTYVLGGYYSGNAGGLSYTQFTQKVASCNLHASTNGATWCAQLYGGSYYMGVYMGGCGGSRYCVDGAVSDQYPQDQGIRVFKDGFCSTETGDFYGAFSTSEYYSGKTLQGYVGIDVLGGVPLWQADDHYLYKGQSAICEIDAVLGGTTAGRAIYSRNNAGEIIMVNYQRIHQGMSPMRPVVVWTDSDFVNWTDKTGNWLSAIGEFTDPASGYRGNATAICFGYDESERR